MKKSTTKAMKKKYVKSRTNGWFMLVDPKSTRILCVTPQKEPESLGAVRCEIAKNDRVD